ncbi:MAG: 4Fe-4S dicluster domain-containing protein [Acidobacteria bacterium]|nr:MAG: 4Fe-4S dicluster domain-containing protein [Acidobacteriota bacterium]REK04140.1 MAG: 4Fe-4S dicluster domain-containing protein [Acidobacteriota bacterium]REK15302.1 MAG: 4Fe-4S dicluster domain-containing protein [Acidobacteriota bacterium]REK46392.1 MAG: 4Fe-4S dicluster domain-containing protein [Acidobacteriota bacterium]
MPSKDSSTNFASLKEKILAKSGKEYWRSVEEYVDAPEFEDFVKQEYPAHAEEWDSSLSRRNFVKVMGASLALAGLSGCVIQPAEKIVPYVNQPEGLVPGKPLFYATAMTLGGVATGLLARSHEGRPTKVEGNPDHPGSLGATDTFAQSSILNLYDPDRSKEILYRGVPKTWQSFYTELRGKIEETRGNGGEGVCFLTETVTSPSQADQFKRLLGELPNAKWYQYEPVNDDNQIEGSKLAFGSPAQPVYKLENAERVLSIDCDLFSGFNVRYIKDFAKARAVNEEKKEINRLYSMETTLSLTGAKADHRIALKPSQVIEAAKAAAGEMGVGGASGSGLSEEVAVWVREMAKDLMAHKGKSVVVVGRNQPAAVHALAFAMNDALGAVGQTVDYIEPLTPNAETLQRDQLAQLIKDIDEKKVKVLVILGGNPAYNTPSDLKFTKERLDNVPFRVHVGEHFDETAAVCHWHVSSAHYLEAWGDTRAYDGTVTIAQPLIDPLYGGRSHSEIVQLCFQENYEKSSMQIVQEFWQTQGMEGPPPVPAITSAAAESANGQPAQAAAAAPAATPVALATPAPSSQTPPETQSTPESQPTPSARETQAAPESPGPAAPRTFEEKWRKAVHDGYIPGTQAETKTVTANTGFVANIAPLAVGDGSLEMTVLPDPCVYDGRYTNNGWLQELPNPLNKITWENVALISPNTAQKLGINQDKRYKDYAGGELGRAFITTKGGNMSSDILEVTFEGAKIEGAVPAWIAPGQPDDVITLFLGYGRTRSGKVGNDLGYNAYDVVKSSNLWFGKGDVTRTGSQTQIASTQIHFNIDDLATVKGRDILRSWTMEEYEEHLNGEAPHMEEKYDLSMYGNEHAEIYEKHNKWAMTIDLNSCVGCNACVVACQSENNIPIVGKEQVERSREMHWMRVDAYYKGTDINEPEGPYFQPVLCMQCEQAPCEVVCPVHATVHSAEGLNDMVYNRCVGTRYCSNNCPYKVRRFNFFLYQDWDSPSLKLMRNPEVTIRSRGVMEKCTYCTQRISHARIEAEREGREIRDGEVVTACQAVCPADAIVFGNEHDKESQIAKTKKDHRNYGLLNYELNTQPRTTYLAGLRNQNKAMPDYVAPKKKEGEGESH